MNSNKIMRKKRFRKKRGLERRKIFDFEFVEKIKECIKSRIDSKKTKKVNKQTKFSSSRFNNIKEKLGILGGSCTIMLFLISPKFINLLNSVNLYETNIVKYILIGLLCICLIVLILLILLRLLTKNSENKGNIVVKCFIFFWWGFSLFLVATVTCKHENVIKMGIVIFVILLLSTIFELLYNHKFYFRLLDGWLRDIDKTEEAINPTKLGIIITILIFLYNVFF